VASTLSKRQVAETELEAAIRLLFRFKDPISAYVLAWAAYDIVGPVSQARGIESVEQEFERALPPDEVKGWRKMRRRHYNFFKHADRDAEGSVEAVPIEMVEVQIFIANLDFQGAFQTLSPIQSLYMSWFSTVYPQFARPELEATVDMLGRLVDFPSKGTKAELSEFVVRMLEAYDHHPTFAQQIKAMASAGRP
jgi:hypothetical protein